MQPEDVVRFLQDNPQFFEEQLDLLATLHLPHPVGGHSISLVERQLIAMREKNQLLERKLQEFIQYGKQNDALQHKLHEFMNALFASHDLVSLQHMVPHLLADIFSAGHVVMRLWQTQAPDEDMLNFAQNHVHPGCLHHTVPGAVGWFGEAEALLTSFAYLPLYAGSDSIGMIVLGSEDKQRYYPGMGHDYLQRIADAVSSAVHPHLER